MNEQLAKLKEDGGLEKISNKWFGGEPCVLHLAGSSEISEHEGRPAAPFDLWACTKPADARNRPREER